MNEVFIENKRFNILIEHQLIIEKVNELANKILMHYSNVTEPIQIVAVMNGAFIFAADLMRKLDQRFRIHFIKLSSYEGVIQSNEITCDHNFKFEVFQNQHVLILDDIIETGRTLEKLIQCYKNLPIKSIHIVCLMIKPASVLQELPILASGFEVEKQFVVGYGMDYCECGRGLKNIYQLIQ